MLTRLMIDRMKAHRPTESFLTNTDDEVYFVVGGTINDRPFTVPRVSPRPPRDYYAFARGTQKSGIRVWSGNLAPGETAYITCVVCDQDNGQLGAIRDFFLAIGAFLTSLIIADDNPSWSAELQRQAAERLRAALEDLAASLQENRDEVIGSFVVRITGQSGYAGAQWSIVPESNTILDGPPAAARTRFRASGAGSDYVIHAAVESLVTIKNRASGKCLDVVNRSVENGANVQQYSCHDGDNQRWKIVDAGQGFVTIFNERSSRCLDVVNQSRNDGANVQQYQCHAGANQRWRIEDVGDSYVRIVNENSGKCLDVADASRENGANVQQFTWNGGHNQQWRIQ